MQKSISGFSKLSKVEKINWLIANHFGNNKQAKTVLESYWNDDKKLQKLHDEFIENTISNFYMPFRSYAKFFNKWKALFFANDN